MNLAIYGPNLPGKLQAKGTFHVHAADCADRKKRMWAEMDSSYEPAHIVDVADRVAVCDFIYTPGEFECESGDYLYDFHFHPCCRDLPVGQPAAAGNLEGR